jgi:hypothetical protein
MGQVIEMRLWRRVEENPSDPLEAILRAIWGNQERLKSKTAEMPVRRLADNRRTSGNHAAAFSKVLAVKKPPA